MSEESTVLVLRDVLPETAVEQVTERWSCLRNEGGRPVLFKPNLINHRHLTGGDYSAVVTQPAVLELAWAVADRLGLSTSRSVADAPQGDADFARILESTGLDCWGRNRGVTLVDLRRERYREHAGVPVAHERLPGDPNGSVRVRLDHYSAFAGLDTRTFYGADFDIGETNTHHHRFNEYEVHEYLFSGTALNAGIVVNLPKLKTHKKAGLTISLKNLVGLNANKNWLPHHTMGTPAQGGDAYPESTLMQRLEAGLARSLKPWINRSGLLASAAAMLKPAAKGILGDTQEVIRSGNWWGNDTIWRMILDLNRVLLYARPDGSIATTPQRRMVSLVDGLIAGEGSGPEAPDRVDAGLLIAGSNPVAVDTVAATLVGFDYRKIPYLDQAFLPHRLPLVSFGVEDIVVESNVPAWDRKLGDIDRATTLRFRPHFGWVDHVELRTVSNSGGNLA
jgi:uncharacterized protein (DUF362 family)